MTTSGPFRGREPWRSGFTSDWWQAATAGLDMPFGGDGVFRAVFDTARRTLVGRRFTVSVGGERVTLTLKEFDGHFGAQSLAIGQADEVRLDAEDVEFGAIRLMRVIATARNLHVRPGRTPEAVAAPVDIVATVAGERVSELTLVHAPRLLLAVGDDGVVRVRWRRHPGLGHVEVQGVAGASYVWIRPRALTVGHRCRLGIGWAFGIPIGPLRLPKGLRITRIKARAGALELHATLPEWRAAVPLGRLERLMDRMRAGSTGLNLD